MVMAVAVAPDGSWLASGSWDGEVRIWDVTTGRAQALMRVDNNIRACAGSALKHLPSAVHEACMYSTTCRPPAQLPDN